IEDNYGAENVGKGADKAAQGRIQDAHEAIRPTYLELTPQSVKDSLTRDQFRLYQLIWNRFLASRMKDAVYETTSVRLSAGGNELRSAGTKEKYPGFLTVYRPSDDIMIEGSIPDGLNSESVLTFKAFDEKQHFTQPPAHYTEATLVRELEELGIGRPSTYSPIITTLQKRHYIGKEKKNLFVTELGDVVNNIMVESFPSIVDVDFTANMESLLDSVEEGNVKYKTVIENFYPDIEKAVEAAQAEITKVKVADEVSDVPCEKCGRMMVIKYGPHGKFLACPGFPECRNAKPFLEKIGVKCPLCGKDIVVRKTKKGRKYYGCENNPECGFMSWSLPSDKKCSKCGSLMVHKGNKLVCTNNECGYIEKDN
ncbi:MAG: type I DNA topoisomerase, partial [Lachnospiraceae bacterium]|nr:type I DNA topoisomerase [Lachnospiraceae bacterium]